MNIFTHPENWSQSVPKHVEEMGIVWSLNEVGIREKHTESRSYRK